MTEWQLIDDLLARSGWPDAETIWQAGGFDAMPDYATSHHLNGYPTPTGKFQFEPDWAKFGPDHARMPKLPDHFAIIDEADDERPFRLVAAPARNYLNTSFTETPTSICKEGGRPLLIHPEDARRLGIRAGDPVRLGNGAARYACMRKSARASSRACSWSRASGRMPPSTKAWGSMP